MASGRTSRSSVSMWGGGDYSLHTIGAKHVIDNDGDLESFAVSHVPTLRTWSETVFFNSLSSDRSERGRRDIVGRFYQSYVNLVREDPTGHAMDYVHIYMVLSKI